jgi:hypothetical protein
MRMCKILKNCLWFFFYPDVINGFLVNCLILKVKIKVQKKNKKTQQNTNKLRRLTPSENKQTSEIFV